MDTNKNSSARSVRKLTMPGLYKQEIEERAYIEKRTVSNYLNYLMEYAMEWKKAHPNQPYPGFYWPKRVPDDVARRLENKTLIQKEPLYLRPSDETFEFFEKVKKDEQYSTWSKAVIDAISFAAWDINNSKK